MDLFKLNKKLQAEAEELLDKTQLIEILQTYGKIELGGSFVYGTMVDRDIDINVIVDEKSINYSLRKAIAEILLDIEILEGIAMTDRYHFKKNGRPNGFWYGPIFNFCGNKWNIDIWFVNQDEPYSHHNNDLHKRMLQITDEQRVTILNIKYAALEAGTKEKGITSSQIYKAVLDNNITTYEEFINQTN